uniref:Protein TIC 214 n=1 Tax=Plantago ovata TaxID=185002 RepID=A0A411LC35_PLAOV|nr:photosystem I assembly protein Ycf1 [Plantago ovata]QBE89883.1 photosystem I assembly protein Ycf1 [Plantago ovata]
MMTFHSFLLGLVPLCMKIINSVVVVGLYYGFLTTFSIGPSYLFLLRAQVMEEGSEKKVAATTGFISGQLLMFLSIYYPPLYIALGRPNTITVLALSYFWLNCWSKKDFFDYESTARNSMRNFRIQWLFVNNLIFQLLNHFFFPSSMLARLVNIYMFRCNNKMLFVTSNFVGWLIGWVIVHNFFRKWLELGLVWIRHRSKKYIRSNKYFVKKWRYSMDRIFSILFFLSCAYALSRIPFPVQILKTINKQTADEEDFSSSFFEEKGEDPNKIDETEKIEVNINENHENSRILQKIKKKKDPFFFEKNLSTLLFDSNQWDRPLRYIKNDNFEKAIRDEMSQYFFDICQSDGKERICFTFPPSVSIFLETLKRSLIPPAPEKSGFHCIRCKNTIEEKNDYELPFSFADEWYTFKNTPVWVSDNKEKGGFLNRIKSLEKESSFLNRLETRTRLCNDNWRKKYLPKRYDPFLSGSCRKTIGKNSILEKVSTKNFIEKFQINRIHQILVSYTDNEQLELKMEIKRFDDKNSESIESTDFLTVIKKAISRSLIIFPYLSYTHACYFWGKLILNNLNDSCGFFFPHPAGTSFMKKLSFLKTHFFAMCRNRVEYFEYYSYIVNERRRTLYPHRSLSRFDFTSCTSSGFSLFFFLGKKFWKQKKDPPNYENLERQKLEREKEKIYENFFLKKLLLFLTHANSQNILTSQNRLNEISKIIPQWEYQLITDEDDMQTEEDNFEIRRREAKRVIIFTDIKETKGDEDDSEDLTMIRYLEQPDFDRDLINGSVRAQRRKVVIWKVFQGNAHSPLFVYRIKNPVLVSLKSNILDMFKSIKSIFRTIVESTNEQTKIEESGIEKEKKNIRDEGRQMKIAARWETHTYGQTIRSCLLLLHSFFRKYILFPSLIIAKNLGRIFLHQRPEWYEDFQELNKEMHIICTYNGTSLSGDLEFPENWWIEGLQIKIIFPFRLKPWHNHQSYAIETVKEAVSFLTAFGLEAKEPFGSPQKGPSFWKPVFNELGKKVGKMKKNYFKGKKKILAKVSKENPTQLREVEIYESNEIQEEKDSIISNQIINQSFSQTRSPGLPNSSLTEKKIKDLTEQIGTIRNQIEKNINKKRKNNMGPNKSSSNAKSLEKWKILIKRRTIRLISKFPLYLKFFIELIYRHIFLYIERIYRHLFLSSIELKLARVCKYSSYINTRLRLTKKIIDKSLNLIKKKPIPFKKSLDNIRYIKSNLHIFFDLSCVSQAYVFYKLSQIQVSNLHKLRSVLQYQGISLFLKPEIKDSLEKQGIVHSKLKLDDQKFTNYEQNEWKNWLRGYYPYDLSSTRWSRLMPEKWRNTSRQPCIDKKEKLRKCNSYETETDRVSNSKKKQEVYKLALANKKENFQKYYRYDLLADKFLNSEKFKEIIYGLTFQGNKNRELSCNTHEDRLYDILKTTPIYNYVDILAVEKMVNRKYLRWKSLYRRQKTDISSITTGANKNQNMQRKTHNYLKISISNAYLNISYFRLPDNLLKFHNVFVDWMGMNEKMLNYSISNLEGWFFPEFVLFHQAYKMKPWFRPNKLLLLNLNRNLNRNEKKKSKLKKKQENQEEITKGKDSGSILSQQKSSEENPVKLDMKKKKSQLDSFLERYLLFQCKWRNDTSDERLRNNQEIYCLLLRLIDPRKIILSSIQTKEMDLDIMMIHHSLTCAELLKKGILILEPIRLFGKNDGLFLMYQTISTSLIDKSKYQTNKKYQKERYLYKNHFYFLIPENILSFKRRRKLRILISFNSKYRKDENRNLVFWNRKNSNQTSPGNKGLNIEENPLMKLKLFLWPNYRLEDLSCMNRYWFNTNNGSRFGMLRIHLYPQLKIRG